ncbi:hypothetical protein [Peribacillus frigoritolerans]|uniref:hypothetical protein n=1 Tax=Peribacillus frigoritolerans TaxID=450367 RepID=UPI002E1B6687|nr:hypothetical protein [Peribacillus frigoritolerans]
MFRRINSFSFGSGYVEEISVVQNLVFDKFENKITASLLKGLIEFEKSVEFLKSDLIDRLDNNFFQSEAIEHLLKKIPVTEKENLLIVLLTNLLSRLSTETKDPISFFNEEDPQEKAVSIEALPSLNEVVFHSKNRISPIFEYTSLKKRTLFHTALAIRDLLVLEGYGFNWSAKFQEKWSGSFREILQYDIAALAFNSLEDSSFDLFQFILQDLNQSVAKDYINTLRVGKSYEEINELIYKKLMPRAIEKINKKLPNKKAVEQLIKVSKTNNVEEIKCFCKAYISEETNSLIVDINETIRELNLGEKLVTPVYEINHNHKKYGNELILRIGASFFINLETPKEKEEAFYSLISELLIKDKGKWIDVWSEMSITNKWFLAIPLLNVKIDKSFKVDNCTFMPTGEAKAFIDEKFQGNLPIGLPEPERESSWAIINNIEAHPQDSEYAILVGRKKIKNILSTVSLLINRNAHYGFKLASFTLFSNELNGEFRKISTNINHFTDGNNLLPLELTDDLNPVNKPWGEYLNIVHSLKSNLIYKVKESLEKFYLLQKVADDQIKFIQLIDCFELLLSKENEEYDRWIDRAVYILAGPNIPEPHFTYFDARTWLKDDITLYCLVKDKLAIGTEQRAISLLLPRLVSMFSDCLFSVYSTLSDPAFNDIDDLVLWYAAIRPDNKLVGGGEPT